MSGSAMNLPLQSQACLDPFNRHGSNCTSCCHESIYSCSRHQTLFPELGGSHLPLHCLIKLWFLFWEGHYWLGKKCARNFTMWFSPLKHVMGALEILGGPLRFPRHVCAAVTGMREEPSPSRRFIETGVANKSCGSTGCWQPTYVSIRTYCTWAHSERWGGGV